MMAVSRPNQTQMFRQAPEPGFRRDFEKMYAEGLMEKAVMHASSVMSLMQAAVTGWGEPLGIVEPKE
jgi:hypothetical protein